MSSLDIIFDDGTKLRVIEKLGSGWVANVYLVEI